MDAKYELLNRMNEGLLTLESQTLGNRMACQKEPYGKVCLDLLRLYEQKLQLLEQDCWRYIGELSRIKYNHQDQSSLAQPKVLGNLLAFTSSLQNTLYRFDEFFIFENYNALKQETELVNLIRKLRIDFNNIYFSLLDKEVRSYFEFYWEDFIYPLYLYYYLNSKTQYLVKNLEALQKSSNYFQSSLRKSDTSTRTSMRILDYIQNRWNLVLKILTLYRQ